MNIIFALLMLQCRFVTPPLPDRAVIQPAWLYWLQDTPRVRGQNPYAWRTGYDA